MSLSNTKGDNVQTFKIAVNQNGTQKFKSYRISSCIVCTESNWIFTGFSDGNTEHLAQFDCLNCGDGTQDYPWEN